MSKRQSVQPANSQVEEPEVETPEPQPEGPTVELVGYKSKDTKVHLIDGFDGKVRYPGSARDGVASTACNCPPGRLAGGARGWSVLLRVPTAEAQDRISCSYCGGLIRQATAPGESTESADGDGHTAEELAEIEAQANDEGDGDNEEPDAKE